jgi:purine-binding chemotaxis protein CheW
MGLALVFWVEQQAFGLPLEAIVRVVRAVAVTAVPAVPANVCGVVDVAGQTVPVIDFRRAIGLPPREMALDDQLLLVRAGGPTLALWADRADGVISWRRAASFDLPATSQFGTTQLAGVARAAAGLIPIIDLETFLPPEAVRSLAVLTGHA